MPDKRVAVLGATSIVGRHLLPILVAEGWAVTAISREPGESGGGVEWVRPLAALSDVAFWISLAPLWVLMEYLPWLERSGVSKVIALSSTSRFSKINSLDPAERTVAAALASAEKRLIEWCERCGVTWVVLQPTLIYDPPVDRNVSDLARFIRRFGFLPVIGKAGGLRQPVHAADVASVCARAASAEVVNRAYIVSGAETIAYRHMASRIFDAVGRTPRFISVPKWVARAGIFGARMLPRYRHLSIGMIDRMDRDLVFDHAAAERDLAFRPRAFALPDLRSELGR